MYLADALLELGSWFLVLGKPGGLHGIPVVAFRLGPGMEISYDEFALSYELEKKGWLVPAYYMAGVALGIKLLTVVCRQDFTHELCKTLVQDIRGL
jgi:glutamate decarboxylase